MDIYSRIRDISIGQIMVFLQCMELKNYSSAAAALNYTPSMVSKTIRGCPKWSPPFLLVPSR